MIFSICELACSPRRPNWCPCKLGAEFALDHVSTARLLVAEERARAPYDRRGLRTKVRKGRAAVTRLFGALLMLSAALVPQPLPAQPLHEVSTSIAADKRGAVLSTTTGTDRPLHHPSRVLVRFRSGARFLPGSGLARALPGKPDLHVVEVPRGLAVAETVRRYRMSPDVLYAEPDYIVRSADVFPGDPLWGAQWDMVKIGAPAAWGAGHTDASDVVVAIIDSGIDFTHPDLAGNLYTDASGSHGYTCMNGACVLGGQDDYGHGTHVAGTIGAVAGNATGIAGINWGVQLLSIKFLGADGGGYVSDALLAFELVTSLKNEGVNIRVTNNSWGGAGFSQALKDAMAAAEGAGVVHVCAAGNSAVNADLSPMYPAAYDNRGIVSVLASDSTDTGAGFTNWGLGSVDIAAPGVSILSTVPTGMCPL